MEVLTTLTATLSHQGRGRGTKTCLHSQKLKKNEPCVTNMPEDCKKFEMPSQLGDNVHRPAESKVKVVGIVCSPRQQGNTDFLVREALTAAKEAGAEEIEVVSVANKTILPCDGCNCCLETAECIIDDDMQDIYPKLLAADGIIMGTPVYFWGVTAQAKAIIDRTYCLVSGHLALDPELRAKVKSHGTALRNKVGGTIIVTARVGATSAFRQISDFFRLHRMVEAGGAIAYGREKGEASSDEQGLAEARWTGRAVVRAIKQRKALEG